MVLSILLFYARSLPGHDTDALIRRCDGPDGHPGGMMKRSIAGVARRHGSQMSGTIQIYNGDP